MPAGRASEEQDQRATHDASDRQHARPPQLAISEPEETVFTPCAITVLGADHMGIIHKVTRYLAEQGLNLETMTTEVVAAPMSGSPLFTMSAVVNIPPQLNVGDLREAMEFIGDEMGVDTKVFAHGDEE